MLTRAARLIATGMPVLALAAGVLSACTLEQILIGQWYTFYTPPAAGCPALEWRFVVNAQRKISGVLSRNPQQPVASLSGLLNPDDSYQITATDVARSRTATVTGRFTAQISTLSIHGSAAGDACDGQTYRLRLGGYFAHQGGGGGGGG